MHIFFSGIGGTAIGPLAQIARQAGFEVSGSDKQNSEYIEYLKKAGITDIQIGQTTEQIAEVHEKKPIDWLVYSSAVAMEQANSSELNFCKQKNIRTSKRDELLNEIIISKNLKLIAISGTHGKTTTTAMLVWLFKKLELPLSYSVGAKISFGDMGKFDNKSEYFVLEADEFDRNFLSYSPEHSLITGITWDHHEIFLTKQDYEDAFNQFISQSKSATMWQEDAEKLTLKNPNVKLLNENDKSIDSSPIIGHFNRLNAWLASNSLASILDRPFSEIFNLLSEFPGLQRRMEQIAPNLYSDYAHTPEKIIGAMSAAKEIASKKNQNLIIVYEPLTNRRQHYMIDDYKDCFKGAEKVYWIPSYLAREDPQQAILTPSELISHLANPALAVAYERDEALKQAISKHLADDDMVVCMAGGGGDSLDEWIRQSFPGNSSAK